MPRSLSLVVAPALLALAACQASVDSPQPAATAASQSPRPVVASPSDAAPSGSPAALTLDRAPADLGCDAIGWPDDVQPFTSLTLRIDPAASPQVWAVSDTGRRLRVEWVPGFEPAPGGALAIVGPDGGEVASDGLLVPLPRAGNARLVGYPLCVTPTTVSVMLPDS